MSIRVFEDILKALNEAFEDEGGVQENGEGQLQIAIFVPENGQEPLLLGDERVNLEEDGKIKRLAVTFRYETITVAEIRQILEQLEQGDKCASCQAQSTCNLPDAQQWRNRRVEAA